MYCIVFPGPLNERNAMKIRHHAIQMDTLLPELTNAQSPIRVNKGQINTIDIYNVRQLHKVDRKLNSTIFNS